MFAAFGRSQIGPEVEQVVLDAAEHGVEFAPRMQARQADRGVGLINRAIGMNSQVVLGPARAVAKPRIALVAGFRVNAIQRDHGQDYSCGVLRQSLAGASMAAMIRTSSTKEVCPMPVEAPEIIEVETTQVSCEGIGGALGHPKVYLEMGDEPISSNVPIATVDLC